MIAIQTKVINITISAISAGLKSCTSDKCIGQQYDDYATKLIFTRPEGYGNDSLILFFSEKKQQYGIAEQSFEPINIGLKNEFALPKNLTQSIFLSMQCAFAQDNAVIAHTNKLDFTLQPSILPGQLPIAHPAPEVVELTDKAFVGSSYEENTLSFTNLAGEIVDSVVLQGGGEIPEATTSVKGITTVGAEDGAAAFDHLHSPDKIRGTTADSGKYLSFDAAGMGITVPAPSGGSTTLDYNFNGTPTEPPVGSQLRFNHTDPALVSKLWIMNETAVGSDANVILMLIHENVRIRIQDKDDHTKFQEYIATGDVIDKGAYVEIPVMFSEGGNILTNQRVWVALIGSTTSSATSPTTDITFFMLPDFYVAVGQTQEVYFESIFRCVNPANYHIVVECAVGESYGRKWSVTATTANVGDYPASLMVYDTANRLLYDYPFTCHIVKPETNIPTVQKILCIGDSLTQGGQKFMGYWLDSARSAFGVSSGILDFVGSKGSAPYLHEGRGGWKISDYLKANGWDGANPFWDVTNNRLSFSYYTTQTGIQPDLIHLLIGINDVFGGRDTVSITADIKTFIDQMRLDWPNVSIYLSFSPMTADQNGIGVTYGSTYSQNLLDKKIVGLAQSNYETFKAYTKLYFVPLLQCFDREYGYGNASRPVNPFVNTITEYFPVNAVHPGDEGNRQFGSIMFSIWMEKHEQGIAPTADYTLTNLVPTPTTFGSAWYHSPGGASKTVTGGVYIMTMPASETLRNEVHLTCQPITYDPTHKYYTRAAMKCSDTTYREFDVLFTSKNVAQNTTKSTDWVPVSIIDLPAATPGNTFVLMALWHDYGTNVDVANKVVSYKEPLLIDLTTAFGAGNEPDQAWCDTNIPFFEASMIIQK